MSKKTDDQRELIASLKLDTEEIKKLVDDLRVSLKKMADRPCDCGMRSKEVIGGITITKEGIKCAHCRGKVTGESCR